MSSSKMFITVYLFNVALSRTC